MRVLILGATGNLARMTATLVAQQSPACELRLTSHRATGCAELRAGFPLAEVVEADWHDEASLRSAIDGADKVLMVTPDFYTDESTVTPNLIRAVKSAGGTCEVVRFIAIPPGFTADRLTAEQSATRCGAALHVVAKPLFDASGLPVTYVNAACWIMFNLRWFLADDIKATRRLLMPSAADAARQWVAEGDIAAVLAKVLTDPALSHAGCEYLLTGADRYTFSDLAALLSASLGDAVTYVDDDSTLRQVMGEHFPALMTYFTHETVAYPDVPSVDTVAKLLGREQVSLPAYIADNIDLFS
ncbi:MAG: hypothetical protein RIR41_2552 [Pseudomonadota bacterium]